MCTGHPPFKCTPSCSRAQVPQSVQCLSFKCAQDIHHLNAPHAVLEHKSHNLYTVYCSHGSKMICPFVQDIHDDNESRTIFDESPHTQQARKLGLGHAAAPTTAFLRRLIANILEVLGQLSSATFTEDAWVSVPNPIFSVTHAPAPLCAHARTIW